MTGPDVFFLVGLSALVATFWMPIRIEFEKGKRRLLNEEAQTRQAQRQIESEEKLAPLLLELNFNMQKVALDIQNRALQEANKTQLSLSSGDIVKEQIQEQIQDEQSQVLVTYCVNIIKTLGLDPKEWEEFIMRTSSVRDIQSVPDIEKYTKLFLAAKDKHFPLMPINIQKI